MKVPLNYVVSLGPTHGRLVVRARSGGLCEVAFTCAATEFQHRVRRSQGGLFDPANGLDLCHWHHQAITVRPAWAERFGWSVPRGYPLAADDHCTYCCSPVRLARHGWVLLGHHGEITPTTRRPSMAVLTGRQD